jgi:hypothetical protein
MICPQCKAEYRQGFTVCADCEVDLVHSVPGAEEGASNRMTGGTLVPFWVGEDLALHTTLLEELEAAGIRYFDEPMGVYPGVRRGDHFPIQPMTRFGYQVAVLSSDLPSAGKILERLVNQEQQDIDLPVNEEKQGETTERLTDPGEKTIREIWVGQDERLAAFLQDALRENEILMRAEVDGAEIRIYVCPSDEQRAREIVREIVEGAPPD